MKLDASEIGKRVAKACEVAGLSAEMEVAGSGSVYLRISDTEDDLHAALRISDHAHLGGGINYYGGRTDLEICTDRSQQADVHGHTLTDALRVLSARFGQRVSPYRRPRRPKHGQEKIENGMLWRYYRDNSDAGGWWAPIRHVTEETADGGG